MSTLLSDRPPHAQSLTREHTGNRNLRRHLVGDRSSWPLVVYLGPLAMMALAGVLRFSGLGRVHELIFDETYYVKQAYSLLAGGGIEHRWPDESDEKFTNGTPSIWLDEPDYVVHPPVGKWMIAIGQLLFGIESTFGWRFSTAVVGVLMVGMVSWLALKLFSSPLLATVAGLFMAIDGHAVVLSRTSLLDNFVAFFALAALCAFVADRFWIRERVAAGKSFALWWRPWRLVAALMLGLTIGTKWSGLYFLAVFGLMTVLWDAGLRHSLSATEPYQARSNSCARRVLRVFVVGIPAFIVIVPSTIATYIATWAGWFKSDNGHLRQWGAEHPSSSPVPDALRSLWKYHTDMMSFHTTLTSPHPYQANPWSWIVMGRPTSFYYPKSPEGDAAHQLCGADQCSQAILDIGNVPIWWFAALMIPVLVIMWALRRDWRAGVILASLIAGYGPWFLYQHRTIYTFYAVAFTPYIVLAATYGIGLILGDPDAKRVGRRQRVIIATALVVAAIAFAWFYWPIWSAQPIPYSEWRQRMWFNSWI